MSMVYCRGCGKALHETAPTCPHCGYVQTQSLANASSNSIWMAVVVSIFALIDFLNWFGIEAWTRNIKNGLWIYSIAILILGVISIQQKRRGFVACVISLIIASLTVLILIGQS